MTSKNRLLAIALIVISGCIVRERTYVSTPNDEIYVQQEPPPPQQEVVTVAPSAGYVWVGGYWRWGGNRWAWAPGYWSAPRAGYAWTPGYWGRRGRGYVYRPGYWRRW